MGKDWPSMEKRKVYSIGKKRTTRETFLVSLPYDWAKKVETEYGGNVIITHYDDKLLIVPEAEKKYREASIDIDGNSPEEMESKITAAYIGNVQKLSIKIKNESAGIMEKLELLRRKLYGTLATSFSNDTLVLSMETPLMPIKNVLGNAEAFSLSMYEKNENLMSLKFPYAGDIVSISSQIDSWENDVDLYTFLSKRYLNRSLIDPESISKLVIKSPQDILEYYSISSNIERFADIHVEIRDSLVELNKEMQEKDKTLKMTGFSLSTFPQKDAAFSDYYLKAVGMVRTAFENSNPTNPKEEAELLRVYKTKRQDYRPGFIEREFREEIIKRSRENPFATHLLKIENKIFAITGIATNIAEAWMNMHRPDLDLGS